MSQQGMWQHYTLLTSLVFFARSTKRILSFGPYVYFIHSNHNTSLRLAKTQVFNLEQGRWIFSLILYFWAWLKFRSQHLSLSASGLPDGPSHLKDSKLWLSNPWPSQAISGKALKKNCWVMTHSTTVWLLYHFLMLLMERYFLLWEACFPAP